MVCLAEKRNFKQQVTDIAELHSYLNRQYLYLPQKQDRRDWWPGYYTEKEDIPSLPKKIVKANSWKNLFKELCKRNG